MFSEGRYLNFLFVTLFIIAAIFLFKNLGNIYLNADEAETALLSRSVLKNAIPIGEDGKFIIQQNKIIPLKSKKNKIWVFHPWLQFYVTALSFAIFGENTFSARLPFALTGFTLFFIFFYFLKKRYDISSFFLISAFILLVFNIPFYLFARQCRYYILNIFFSFTFFVSYLEMLSQNNENSEEKPWKILWVVSTVLLFYSNYVVFFAMFCSILLHLYLFHSEKFKKVLLPSMITGVLTFPYAIFLEIWKRREEIFVLETFSLGTFFSRVIRYILYINTFHISLLFIAFFLTMVILKKKTPDFIQYFKQDIFTSSAIIIMGNIFVFSCIVLHDYRFFVQLILFLILILAGMLDFLRRIIPKWVVMLFLLVFISGNYLNMLPLDLYLHIAPLKATSEQLDINWPSVKRLNFRPFQIDSEFKRNPLLKATLFLFPNFNWQWFLGVKRLLSHQYSVLDYIYEITHDYQGPIKGIVKFLKKNAKKGDKVKIFYGDLSLQFYLGDFLEIIPKLNYYEPGHPRWWIYRHQKKLYASEILKPNRYEQKSFKKYYVRYKLADYPDVAFNNLPTPEYHYFRTPEKKSTGILVYDYILGTSIYCKKDMLPDSRKVVMRMDKSYNSQTTL